jgi:predicted dehydrogenase
MTLQQISRRDFIAKSAAIGVIAAGVHSSCAAAQSTSPNEKLNIGFVGTANQALFSLSNCKIENIAALCDVDELYLGRAAATFKSAKKFTDFRKLMDDKTVDAIVVCTPDHIHAPATLAALFSGKHVYCEKPLTHTVEEARLIREAAAKNKRLATQMGTRSFVPELLEK